jgi:hypothetical protein
LEDFKNSGNPPWEDLVKSGCKLEIKYNISLIILLRVWLHNGNHIYKTGDFFFSILAPKPLKSYFFSNFQFSILVFGNTPPVRKGWL